MNLLEVLSVQILRNKIARYIVVGGLAYAGEMGMLYVLINVYSFSRLSAAAVSFWFGFFAAFLLQKFIAFEDRQVGRRVIAKQLAMYSLLVLFNYGFTLLAVYILSPFISVYIVRSIVICMATIWNFLIYKKMFQSADETYDSDAD